MPDDREESRVLLADESRAPSRIPRRSWQFVAVVVLLVSVPAMAFYFWVPGLTPLHYGGDPWGSKEGALRSEVMASLPPDAVIIESHATASRWITNGCDGSIGWTPPMFSLVFTSRERSTDVLDGASRSLRTAGWERFPTSGGYAGRHRIWTKRSDTVATMELGTDNPDTGNVRWQFGGYLRPDGRAVQTC